MLAHGRKSGGLVVSYIHGRVVTSDRSPWVQPKQILGAQINLSLQQEIRISTGYIPSQ